MKENKTSSTFTDKKTAIKAVQENLRNNADAIAAWVSSGPDSRYPKIFRYTHTYNLGKGIYQKNNVIRDGIYESIVCLKGDKQTPFGFIIDTAYPGLKGLKNND